MAEIVGWLIVIFIIGPIVIDVVFGLGLLTLLPFDQGPKTGPDRRRDDHAEDEGP